MGRLRMAGSSRIVMVVRALALSAIMVAIACAGPAQAQQGTNGLTFSPPLGFRDGQTYAPHFVKDASGTVIENTGYGVTNLDLVGATCFGLPWQSIFHSGEDLYRTDGQSAAGAEVTAVADGVVAYANPYLNYPGLVIIIEHTLAGGARLYSVYAHIDDNSLAVTQGQAVTRGQKLGTVMYQRYTGRFPERHPTMDDSHLHFEIRHFFSGYNIYPNYPACNGLIAGRGYTYPQTPDNFPAPDAGYVNPASVIPGMS